MTGVWSEADAYEAYMGRWSRALAPPFLGWLDQPPGLRWLDVGCGTGALSQAILDEQDPRSVAGIDPSAPFVSFARTSAADARTDFQEGDARDLPFPDAAFDVCVSGLALNFVPDPAEAAAEMRRVTAPGGIVAAYVWDYAEGMELTRRFWDAAVSLDAAAAREDEGGRFSFCQPEPLAELFAAAGLTGVEVAPIVIPIVFKSFDDYWAPFLRGVGPAPAYAVSLGEEQRRALEDLLRRTLPTGDTGAISLTARAWAVRGRRP